MSLLGAAPSCSGLESLGYPKPADKVFAVHIQASAGQANKDQGLEAGVSRGWGSKALALQVQGKCLIKSPKTVHKSYPWPQG